MKVTVEIPDYSIHKGVTGNYIGNHTISFIINDDGSATLLANKDGLLTLANHFLSLAQDVVPVGRHFHMDDFGGLFENGSNELIVEKM